MAAEGGVLASPRTTRHLDASLTGRVTIDRALLITPHGGQAYSCNDRPRDHARSSVRASADPIDINPDRDIPPNNRLTSTIDIELRMPVQSLLAATVHLSGSSAVGPDCPAAHICWESRTGENGAIILET